MGNRKAGFATNQDQLVYSILFNHMLLWSESVLVFFGISNFSVCAVMSQQQICWCSSAAKLKTGEKKLTGHRKLPEKTEWNLMKLLASENRNEAPESSGTRLLRDMSFAQLCMKHTHPLCIIAQTETLGGFWLLWGNIINRSRCYTVVALWRWVFQAESLVAHKETALVPKETDWPCLWFSMRRILMS